MQSSPHGSIYRYKRLGCRCDLCRKANSEANRRWRSNRSARGDSYKRKDREYSPRRPCADCGFMTRAISPVPRCKPCGARFRRSVAISPADRYAIYERDGWTCGICNEAVESGLPNSSPWQATLDHVIPRSRGGGDDAENLRLTHRYCNSVRSSRVELTLDQLS